MRPLAARLTVFVASPGDTQEERDRLDTIVAELNRGIARDRGLVLELVRWETHARPGIGLDAQDVINRQVPVPDLVIGVFWKRLGTPTPRAASGTAEEIALAVERWGKAGDVEILVYFNQQPYAPVSSEIEQITRLLQFRSDLESQGLLVWNYQGTADFETKVREHLTAAIRAWSPESQLSTTVGGAPTAARQPRRMPEGLQRIEVDVARAGTVNLVVSDVRAALVERGFGRNAGDRMATVLLELLANVRDHSASSEAVIEIEVRDESVRCAAVDVLHRGERVNLKRVLEEGWRRYQQGDREHGLVKASRRLGACIRHSQRPTAGLGSAASFSTSPRGHPACLPSSSASNRSQSSSKFPSV